MATEIEMKMKVPDRETLARVMADPALQEFVRDEPTVTHMSSIYYDTPDGDLTQRKWTLRRRAEGEQVIIAMKTANISADVGFFTRGEWQCAADSVDDAIPMLIDQGAPQELKSILKGQRLVEKCRAEFDRTSVFLYMEDGVRIEMVGDVGELRGGNAREPICEVELELLFGGAESLPPICNRLAEEYGLSGECKSKYERAAALGPDAAFKP